MKKLLLITGLLFLITACTENQRVRNFGGTESVKLKDNEVLQNMTWKKDDMWIQTKDTITGICYFRESSSWGVWEGEVIIQ